MSEKDIEAVVSECRRPGQKLVGVQCGISRHGLRAAAVHCLGIAAGRSLEHVRLGIEEVVCEIDREFQIFENLDVNVAPRGEVVIDSLVLGSHKLAVRVGELAERPVLTPVIFRVAVCGILLFSGLEIVSVNRIDRSDCLAEEEEVVVGRRAASAVSLLHRI